MPPGSRAEVLQGQIRGTQIQYRHRVLQIAFGKLQGKLATVCIDGIGSLQAMLSKNAPELRAAIGDQYQACRWIGQNINLRNGFIQYGDEIQPVLAEHTYTVSESLS